MLSIDNLAVSVPSRPQLSPEDFAYLPEDRGLYQDRTILDNLGFIAELRGLDKSLAQQRIHQFVRTECLKIPHVLL